MAEIKKSAVAAAETKNIKPSYYYITKIMKVKTRVMMNLLEMQLEQKQGA